MIRVACTALLKRIKAGRPNKAGNSFIGGGDDVTSDCIKAIIEFVGVGGIHEVTVNGKLMYEIEVRYPQPVEQTEAIPCGWIRGVESYVPGEPTEWHVEFSWGDDQPEDDHKWEPVYRIPPAQTEQDDELEALKADNASLLDSLTKESIARCELEDRLAQTERALTDEQIVEAGYMHTVEDDEPLFAFDRKELIAMVRELLTAAQPASGGSDV